MIGMITQYLGYAAWILLLIPIVLLVRLLVKRSRWSILRMMLVSLIGVAIVSLWLHYSEMLVAAVPNSYAGALGTYLASLLEGWVGSTPLSFFQDLTDSSVLSPREETLRRLRTINKSKTICIQIGKVLYTNRLMTSSEKTSELN